MGRMCGRRGHPASPRPVQDMDGRGSRVRGACGFRDLERRLQGRLGAGWATPQTARSPGRGSVEPLPPVLPGEPPLRAASGGSLPRRGDQDAQPPGSCPAPGPLSERCVRCVGGRLSPVRALAAPSPGHALDWWCHLSTGPGPCVRFPPAASSAAPSRSRVSAGRGLWLCLPRASVDPCSPPAQVPRPGALTVLWPQPCPGNAHPPA